MKSIAIGLLCLLCSLAWAEDDFEPVLNDEELPQPIISTFTYESGRYGMSLYKLTWFEAQLFCASNSYTLANIPTELTQSSLLFFIQTFADSDLSLLANESIWTSGTNQGGANQYVWHSSGARFNYRNFPSTPASGFRCVGINAITGYWTADNCRDRHYFVCEKASCAKKD